MQNIPILNVYSTEPGVSQTAGPSAGARLAYPFHRPCVQELELIYFRFHDQL